MVHDDHIFANANESKASSLYVSDVGSFGIKTALAEEEIALGNFDMAEKLAKEAIELAGHTGEENNIYSAYAQGILADALFKEGAFREAAEQYSSALKAYERHYRAEKGPEMVELVGAAQVIAWGKLRNGEFDDAKSACLTALGMTQQLMGRNSTDSAASMVNLATAYMNTGDLSVNVEVLLKEALEIYLTHQDPRDNAADGPDIATKIGHVYLNLGNLYYLRGDVGQAEELYLKVDQRGSSINPEILSAALKNLGNIVWHQGDRVRAESLLARALLAIEFSSTSVVEHPQAAVIRAMLAGVRDDRLPPPIPHFYDKKAEPKRPVNKLKFKRGPNKKVDSSEREHEPTGF